MSKQQPRSTLYIKHRTKGTSQPDLDKKPPLFCCYAPPPNLWCAPVVEQNKCCETIGSVGCYDGPKARRFIFIGVFVNIVSFGLLIFACFALSTNFDTIRAAGYSSGNVALVNNASDVLSKLDIGLRAVAFEQISENNPDTPVGKYVITFDEMCDLEYDGLARYQDPADCEACADVSSSLVTTVIIAVITTIPTFFTDIQRMYTNYDTNCAKFVGTVMSLLSFCLSMYTWLGYANTCFGTFYDGLVPIYLNGTVANEGDDSTSPTVELNFDWSAGNGIICLVLATLLKLVDILVLSVIPTPEITRVHPLQQEYEERYGNSHVPDADNTDKDEENLLEDAGGDVSKVGAGSSAIVKEELARDENEGAEVTA